MKLIINQKNRKLFQLNIFFFPISLISIFIFLQVYFGFYLDFFDLLTQQKPTLHTTDIDLAFYKFLVGEDGPIENATAILFFLSGIFGFIVTKVFFRKGNKKFGFLYLFLSINFMILGFEEISWGQRMFNLETPELFLSNLQGQITIHNLESIKVYLHDFLMIFGFVGSFLWVILRKWEGTRLKSFIRFFVPSWYLIFYFFPIFIFYFIGYFMPYDHQRFELGDWLPLNDQEPPELLLSLGIVLFVGISFLRQKAMVQPVETNNI